MSLLKNDPSQTNKNLKKRIEEPNINSNSVKII